MARVKVCDVCREPAVGGEVHFSSLEKSFAIELRYCDCTPAEHDENGVCDFEGKDIMDLCQSHFLDALTALREKINELTAYDPRTSEQL